MLDQATFQSAPAVGVSLPPAASAAPEGESDLRDEAAYLSVVCDHYRRRFDEAASTDAAASLRLCVEAVGVLMDSSRRFAAAVEDARQDVSETRPDRPARAA